MMFMTYICSVAIGVATGTGIAQSEKADRLTKEVHFAQVPHVGGGDADIHSKPGRTTTVKVTTRNLVNRGTHVEIEIEYSVFEVAKNNTLLKKTDNVRIAAPKGYTITKIRGGLTHTEFSNGFKGEDHGWHDVSSAVNVTSTYFSSLNVKFDGKGDDDKGNAQMKGTIAIPVKLKKKDEE